MKKPAIIGGIVAVVILIIVLVTRKKSGTAGGSSSGQSSVPLGSPDNPVSNSTAPVNEATDNNIGQVSVESGQGSTGYLNVNCYPIGATVSANGEIIGVSPLMVSMTPGTYNIAIEADGYQVFQTTIQIAAGDFANINTSLVLA